MEGSSDATLRLLRPYPIQGRLAQFGSVSGDGQFTVASNVEALGVRPRDSEIPL